jgi:hypothetical protein
MDPKKYGVVALQTTVPGGSAVVSDTRNLGQNYNAFQLAFHAVYFLSIKRVEL